MWTEMLSPCIFGFGFTFPGCGHVLPYSRQADLCQGTVEVLGWQNAPPAFPGLWACMMRSQRDVFPLSFSLSQQGFSKGKKASGSRERD